MKNPYIQIVSSLEKVLPDSKSEMPNIEAITLLQNEAASFQIVIACDDVNYNGDCYLNIEINSPLKQNIRLYTVGLVPCLFPAGVNSDGDYITKKPSLLPDLLQPWNETLIRLRSGFKQSLWAELFCEDGIQPGDYPIELVLKSRDNTVLCTQSVAAHVISATLPHMDMRHTEWFACDCLCDYYGCEMFSSAFFDIAQSYVRFAVQHGVNTLLTPLFTPSLDVEEGCSRKKAQLIGIKSDNGKYTFDFTLLHRWIDIFSSCGIESFEMAPFFTQWGSKFAVEIYAAQNGSETESKLFGWDTIASSKSYAEFLSQFLPALIDALREFGVKEHVFFHISDEPSVDNISSYRTAYNMVAPYIDGCPIIDALSDYSFYKEGLVKTPVVAVDHIQPFINHSASPLWAYYCCSQGNKVPNRFIAMPSRRNRVLGVLLYLYHIDGFLQWGYNYWYSQFSKELIDPYRVTDAGLGFPSGDPFLVYPGAHGEPVASIRIKIFREALQDMRALYLLEQLSSRQNVCELIQSICGKITFKRYPRNNAVLNELHDAVNLKIEKLL
ncbi:MAG: DUF4091 domain-containing protein [Oscillospiraceae bacterium]